MITDYFSKYLNSILNKDYVIFDSKFENGLPVFDKIFVSSVMSPVIIIYGDNASGKSLFTKLLEVILRKENIPVRSACMSNRTASGFQRAMIFGDESDQSTGETSISVAIKCLNSTLSGSSGVAILDEPDIGLSDRYQAAFGKYIAETANNFTDHGLVLVSHNIKLISSFLENYNSLPSLLGINTDLTYPDWQKNQKPATVEELLNLGNYANDKWRAINKTLTNRNK